MTKSNYELERDNFYKWMDTCPLTNYRISDSCMKSVIYEFHFNSVEPDIDQLVDDVLDHLKK
jgi:hypothetical protein